MSQFAKFLSSSKSLGATTVPYFGSIVLGIIVVLCCCLGACIISICMHDMKLCVETNDHISSTRILKPKSDNPGEDIEGVTEMSSSSPWKKSTDNEDRVFWFNFKTRESRWTDPLTAQTSDLPPNWEAIHDQNSDKLYYYNAFTGQSKWNAPTNEGPEMGLKAETPDEEMYIAAT